MLVHFFTQLPNIVMIVSFLVGNIQISLHFICVDMVLLILKNTVIFLINIGHCTSEQNLWTNKVRILFGSKSCCFRITVMCIHTVFVLFHKLSFK